MTASAQFGHTASLHKNSENPAHGFGYKEPEDAHSRMRLWNTYTKEACEHAKPCGLCGFTYIVTPIEAPAAAAPAPATAPSASA